MCILSSGLTNDAESHGHTYILKPRRVVKAISQFIPADPLKRIPCYGVGVAMAKHRRGQGLGTQIVSKGLEEFRERLRPRENTGPSYVDAAVSTSNVASNKLSFARQAG